MIAIYSSISISLLIWLVFFAYQSYRVDKFRQDLFKIRGQLFDEALTGGIAFDDKGYEVTRQMINGLIRFAHEVTMIQHICFRLFFASLPKNSTPSVQSLLGDATPKGQEVFKKYSHIVHLRVIAHLASSPPFVVTMFVPLLMIASTQLGFNLFETIRKRTKSAFASLERVAYAHGR